MKIGKFDIKNWRWYYNGRELANPLVILWRAIWTIPIYGFGWLLYFSLLIGRGSFYSDDFRRNYL